ncbi:antizyme inhibitor 2 isoform X2 [Meriones unguiculatus]|uniref:antizyme inhibitor 2 isoform X2 n=1 Tax=Meriones unguiculatus TaxID=10047 RepID=UPI000B4F7C4C|nr:antizyme inhibitor 2 isoform X2 [Meriones unguiculatus]
MAGYLSESDFVMVEEGFSTRDLLEELTLGASEATTGKVAAFFVADLGAVVRKHFCFLKYLPRVRPFYAVRCNSSLGVLKVLAELGLGFSCASKAEMELVQHIGVPASKIICANPCKQTAQIKYAAKHGVSLLSFDNEVELAKVVKSHPSAKMVLCIATQDSHSLSHLSLRFGASLKSCRHLLENAKKSHVEVVGVSFHIGSGCPDPQAYAQSIADARLVFQMGAELGHTMNILDLGGGFPGLEGAKVRFEEIASVINSALDLYFPEGCGVDILAELGRYYVTSAFTVAVSIAAKKEVLLDQPSREEETSSAPTTTVYHLDEGVYGIFNSVMFDNACPTPTPQKGSASRAAAACRRGPGCRGRVQTPVLRLGDHRHLVFGPCLHPSKHHVSGPGFPENPSGTEEIPRERWARQQAGTRWPGLWCSLCLPHAPPVVFLPCK